MTTVDVRPVDVDDDVRMRQWYAVLLDADRERAVPGWPPVDVALATFRTPRPDRVEHFLLAELDGVPAGAGRLTFNLGENERMARVKVLVAPTARRRGIGSALLAAMEQQARDHGCDTVLSDLGHPFGEPSAGSAFAEARGYPAASREVLKAADLAATAHLWPALAERAAGPSSSYELVWWTDETPEQHLDSLAHLYTRFLAEIPLGDVEIEPQQWDGARIRGGEERRRSLGIRSLLVAAQAPDGSLAGYTNVVVLRDMTHAELESTLVLPEHRGHALGLAMKTLLHQRCAELHADVTRIVTVNAGVNRWMNAVNEALGYVDLEECVDVQKKLAPS